MRWFVTGMVGLLCAAFVALAGAGGWFYWDRVESRGAELTRQELPPLAKDQIPKIFGYDYQTVERNFDDMYLMLTPDFRKEFRDTAQNIIREARERNVVSQANVVGVGVTDAHRRSGSVMVYLNVTFTNKTGERAYNGGSRIEVDYQRLDGKWLINFIKVI
jgi:Mce-associated membrane protein